MPQGTGLCSGSTHHTCRMERVAHGPTEQQRPQELHCQPLPPEPQASPPPSPPTTVPGPQEDPKDNQDNPLAPGGEGTRKEKHTT